MRPLAACVLIGCAIACLGGARGQAAAGHSAASVSRVLRCFRRHHAVVVYVPTGARKAGLTTGKWINFHFIGVPAAAIDGGSVIVEPNKLSAQREARRLFQVYYAYDLARSVNTTPAAIRDSLHKLIKVSGAGIEFWGDTIVSSPARRIVASCLAATA
jgi:hypothetical protein